MSCGHDANYVCPRCGECYQCRHHVVEGTWAHIHVGWTCPDNFVKPAYGPGFKWYEED